MAACLDKSVCLLCLAGRSVNAQRLRGRRMQAIHLSRSSFIILKQYHRFSFCCIPSWTEAIEVYCYALKTLDFKLKSICEAFFSENPLRHPEAKQMVQVAAEMGIGDYFLFPDGTRYKTLPDSEYLEYFFLQNSKRLNYEQLLVPLQKRTPREENPGKLENDSRLIDVENEVFLSVRKGVHKIIGLEMQFGKPRQQDENMRIKVSCKAFNPSTKKEISQEQEMVLRNRIVIHFRDPLKVNLEHKALIKVQVQDVRLCWCPYMLNIDHGLNQYFRADFRSDADDMSHNKIFFLTKLFYAKG